MSLDVVAQVVTVVFAVLAIIWNQQRAVNGLRGEFQQANKELRGEFQQANKELRGEFQQANKELRDSLQKLGDGLVDNGQRLARIEGHLGIGVPSMADD